MAETEDRRRVISRVGSAESSAGAGAGPAVGDVHLHQADVGGGAGHPAAGGGAPADLHTGSAQRCSSDQTTLATALITALATALLTALPTTLMQADKDGSGPAHKQADADFEAKAATGGIDPTADHSKKNG